MVMKPKLPPLLVRADADGARGIGHVLRSLVLAHAWHEQGGTVEFLTAHPTPALRRRMESRRRHRERNRPNPVPRTPTSRRP